MMAGMTEETQHSKGMEPPATAHVQVNIDAEKWTRRVVVNGQEWTRHLSEVHLAVKDLDLPHVVLKATPMTDFTFDGPGVVTVVRDREVPWRDVAAAWLGSLNWPDIAAQAAEGAMSTPLAESFRNVLLGQLRKGGDS
jgi:hypothetical protein